MTRIERMRAEWTRLNEKYRMAKLTCKVATAAALELKMAELQREIDLLESQRSTPVQDLLADHPELLRGTIDRMIRLHVAADYLARCAYELEDYMKEKGFCITTILPELKAVAAKAQTFAGELIKKNPKFEDLMVDNDTLLNSLDKKVISFLTQRIKKADKVQTIED